MSKLENPELNSKVYIKQDIVEYGSECHPPYIIATRGDIVFVKELREINTGEFIFFVAHSHIKDNSFRVSRDEIMLTDPLITSLDIKAYLKKMNYKSLEERIR